MVVVELAVCSSSCCRSRNRCDCLSQSKQRPTDNENDVVLSVGLWLGMRQQKRPRCGVSP